ncbi:threonine/serine dehydratase [Haliscomenobacter sp.]|uniref:threonine ammonia-lyase n=1 Tax=Haliscomenobacter sp. TaxID=2717303 RepID=UPI0035941F89
MQPLVQMPSAADIQQSHALIQPYIHRTPVLTCQSINTISGAQLFFKCENFQKIGAFKMRGASNAALRLDETARQKGLATHSSGNHAQAVAKIAQALGVPAHIVMPENAPSVKREATAGYGANIVLCEATQAARESTLAQVLAETGATFIHPYDDYNVIAGQATAALELIQEVADLDAIISPIGGGGLMSGTALSTRYFSPNTKIYGAEPEQVNDAWLSFKSGVRTPHQGLPSIADGLLTNLSERTFDIIKTYLSDVFTVTEAEIVAAMQLVYERMKIVVEPSCVVPLAAVLKNGDVFAGKKVGIILTGGNVDVRGLPF